MRSGLKICLVLLLLTPPCFSTSCRTCKNEGCFSKDIPLIQCNKNVPKLLIQEPSQVHKENLQYGCLKLEYLNGNSLITLEQCIITEDINDYCPSISKTAHIVHCIVHSPTNIILTKDTFLINRRINDQDKNIDISYRTGSDTQSDKLVTALPPSTPLEDVKIISEYDELDSTGNNKNILTTLSDFEQDITRSDENSSKNPSTADASTIWPFISYNLMVTTEDNDKDEDATTMKNTLTTTFSKDSLILIDSDEANANKKFFTNDSPELTNVYSNLEPYTTSEEDLKNSESHNSAKTHTVETFDINDLKTSYFDKSTNTEVTYSLTAEDPSDYDSVSELITDSPTTIDLTSTADELISSNDFTSSESNLEDLERAKLTSTKEDVTTTNPRAEYVFQDSTTIQTSENSTEASNITTLSDLDRSGLHDESTLSYESINSNIKITEGDLKLTEMSGITTINSLENSSPYESSDVTTQQVNVHEMGDNLNIPESEGGFSIISLTTVQSETTSSEREDDSNQNASDFTTTQKAESSYNNQETITESATSIPDISDNEGDLKIKEMSGITTINSLENSSPYESSDVTTQQVNVHEMGNNLNIPESEGGFSTISITTVQSESTNSEKEDDSNQNASDLTTTEKAESSYDHQETITESATSLHNISDNEGDFKSTETSDTTTKNALDSLSLHESSDFTTVQQENVYEVGNNLNIPESETNSAVVSLTTPQLETTSTGEAGDLEDLDELTSIIPPEPERRPNSVSGHRTSFYMLILLTTISLLNLKYQ